MGFQSATIEMRAPEEHRERLHELVKAARTVMVLSGAAGADRLGTGGMPMALVRTADDTTMYAATLLDPAQAKALERSPFVTVVVLGGEYAMFSADAVVSRDRALIDSLWSDSWRQWCRSKSDAALAIVILSPIEGAYWEARERQEYMYRLIPPPPPRVDAESDQVSLDL
jgi:general stress protein 26